MWCVSALAMCCAASEMKRCVIVMVQLYYCVFTFVVFVGQGWLKLVPAHLPHLRMLCLEGCSVCNRYIEEAVATVPELVVINPLKELVGRLRNKQQERVYGKLIRNCQCITTHEYEIIRQWALGR
jgi:hypothetical protein